MQGALAASYILLAQAQLSQFLGPVWTLSWWEYHGLMFAATVLALGALFSSSTAARSRTVPSPRSSSASSAATRFVSKGSGRP